MASKQVDVGFLPPTAYVLAHEKKAANVILQAQRFGVENETGAPTKDLVDYYKSEFVVKKDSNINSVKDLKGKNWLSRCNVISGICVACSCSIKRGN